MAARRSRAPLILALLAPLFLLQGEKPPSDPRFVSPVRTVRTFWQAVLDRSGREVLECFAGSGVPAAAARGLRMPALRLVEVRHVRVTPLGRGRALVRYEVRYRMRDALHGGSFRTADELVRVRGQWRILRPVSPPPDGERPARQPRPRVHVEPGPDFA